MIHKIICRLFHKWEKTHSTPWPFFLCRKCGTKWSKRSFFRYDKVRGISINLENSCIYMDESLPGTKTFIKKLQRRRVKAGELIPLTNEEMIVLRDAIIINMPASNLDEESQ